MIKTFQKKSFAVKTFFAKDVKVRSFAYGEKVRKEFSEWVDYYKSRQLKCNGKFILSAQDNLYGVSEEEREEANKKSREVKPLCLEGEWFSLDGGQILIDGNKVLNAGSEIKAISLAVYPIKGMSTATLLVIGKKLGSDKTSLTVYKYKRNSLTLKETHSVIMPSELSEKSLLTCFGRHVFSVHGNKLYYFYLTDECKLQTVSLGENNGEEKEFQSNVKDLLITDGKEKVYWVSNDSVYSVKIGFPTAITCSETPKNETVTNVTYKNGELDICRRKKSGYDVPRTRYGF